MVLEFVLFLVTVAVVGEVVLLGLFLWGIREAIRALGEDVDALRKDCAGLRASNKHIDSEVQRAINVAWGYSGVFRDVSVRGAAQEERIDALRATVERIDTTQAALLAALGKGHLAATEQDAVREAG